MNANHSAPVQFHTNGSIGLQVANAVARKGPKAGNLRPHGVRCCPALTGNVIEDMSQLGTSALVDEVRRRIQEHALDIIVQDEKLTHIRVCGVLDYVIDRSSQNVWAESAPLTRRERASRQRSPWASSIAQVRVDRVDILNPLCRPAWLLYVAERPDWFGYAFAQHATGQRQLFVREDELAPSLDQVVAAAWRQLRNDSGMQGLRHRLIAALTLHIGPGLVDLAMRSRVQTRKVSLLARHLNLVWRHQIAFETMAQENPRLLPALTAWLAESGRMGTPCRDALPQMKHDLLAQGLPQKAWRELVQHGFRPFCVDPTGNNSWRKSITLLRALHMSRWPALPPRGFLRLMHDVAGVPAGFAEPGDGTPGWLWQLLCDEAALIHGDTVLYRTLYEAVPHWTWMVRALALSPDKNQRRRGLPWLRNMAQQWATLTTPDRGPVWALWLIDTDWGSVQGFDVIPILSPSDLLQEAAAMHNCVDGYEESCRRESIVLLSLRQTEGSRRLALACLKRVGRKWRLVQLAGPCNMEASSSAWRAASQTVAVVERQFEEVSDTGMQCPAKEP